MLVNTWPNVPIAPDCKTFKVVVPPKIGQYAVFPVDIIFVAFKVPPTFKFLVIPTPPEIINAPVEVLILSVVLVQYEVPLTFKRTK